MLLSDQNDQDQQLILFSFVALQIHIQNYKDDRDRYTKLRTRGLRDNSNQCQKPIL